MASTSTLPAEELTFSSMVITPLELRLIASAVMAAPVFTAPVFTNVIVPLSAFSCRSVTSPVLLMRSVAPPASASNTVAAVVNALVAPIVVPASNFNVLPPARVNALLPAVVSSIAPSVASVKP